MSKLELFRCTVCGETHSTAKFPDPKLMICSECYELCLPGVMDKYEDQLFARTELHVFNSTDPNDYHYPSALEWMWNYCVSLGKYTCPRGHNYDLGIWIDQRGCLSDATVYGNEPGNYSSGDLSYRVNTDNPVTQEVMRRARELGFVITKSEDKLYTLEWYNKLVRTYAEYREIRSSDNTEEV